VAEAGKALGLDSTYIPFSYIEQVTQLATAVPYVHDVSEPDDDASPAPVGSWYEQRLMFCSPPGHRCSWKSSRSSSRW
jgi:hypothetical protein